MTMRDARYIDIPGSKTHELPPLLVHSAVEHAPAEDIDSVLGEAEEMLSVSDASPDVIEQRRFELALQLRQQYKGLVSHWLWGDSILEWVRQCEITFGSEDTLRNFLHPDVWPHASRASFVTLLMEKDVPTHGVSVNKAVGLRLIFREPSPLHCFSGHFLFFLSPVVADTAYTSWSGLAAGDPALLPPDRFHFDVVKC
jgi:hypothetical protein